MSSELETLDQLLGGDLPLAVIRKLFGSSAQFSSGMIGLLDDEAVELVDNDGSTVPAWRWRAAFRDDPDGVAWRVRITGKGARRIG